MKWLAVVTTQSVIEDALINHKMIISNQLMLESIPGEMVEFNLPLKARVLFAENAWQDVLKAGKYTKPYLVDCLE